MPSLVSEVVAKSTLRISRTQVLLFMPHSPSLDSSQGAFFHHHRFGYPPNPRHSTINNVLGPKTTLMLGAWGYPLYISSFLYVLCCLRVRNFTNESCRVVNIHPNAGTYVIVSGAVLGVCAAMLWTAQGSLMMSYPTEAQKGLYIGIFWAIFNLGGVVGSAVALGQNFHSVTNSGRSQTSFVPPNPS